MLIYQVNLLGENYSWQNRPFKHPSNIHNAVFEHTTIVKDISWVGAYNVSWLLLFMTLFLCLLWLLYL